MRTLKFLVIPLLLLFLVGFILFLTAQIANLVLLADRYNPLFGDIVLYTLTGLVLVLVLIPFITYLRLPKAKLPPQTDDPEQVAAYRASLVRRYQKNRILKRENLRVETEKDIPAAVDMLTR